MKSLTRSLLSPVALAAVLALGACGGTPETDDPTCVDGVRNGDETDVDCGGACPACLDDALCVADGDCVSGYCGEGACAAPACDDGDLNGQETDVDCGGPDCTGCSAGKACAEAGDCASGDCTDGACVAAPSCTDEAQNGEETDVDCGGTLCDPCADGLSCLVSGDCASGLCEAEQCVPAPSCDDGEQNGEETDVDCGGSDCDACPVDWSCLENGDCVTGLCEAGVCVAPPACDDGEKNGDESDVDCGGSCAGCADDKQCNEDSDCVNAFCEAGLCKTVDPCSNGRKDGTESDVDCGGDSCGPCPEGWACNTPDDCQGGFISPICEGGICGGPYMCDDGSRNGHETDVDCGGGLCRPCGEGLGCEADDDCMSGSCVGGTCTAAEDTCSNGVHDGFESDVDCGGPCAPCEDGWMCLYDSDCDWSWCEESICGGSWMCEDEALNGHETDVDCGGTVCLPCREGGACLVDSDCGSMNCADGACVGMAATCGDGSKNDYETDVDCGGRGCVACAPGRTCNLDEDCTTGFCDAAGVCAYNVMSLQQSDDSLTCAASGVTGVNFGVSIEGLIVSTPPVERDVDTTALWVQHPGMDWPSFGDPSYTGILAVVDAGLATGIQQGDKVDVVGDYEEHDCESVLRIRAPMGSITTTISGLMSMPAMVPATPFENGGDATAEPYEGTLVRLNNVSVTDATGFSGTEGPGQPHWWIKVGNGVYVANDFGVTTTLVAGDTLSKLIGVVTYRHGVYLLVPRSDADIAVQ